MSNKSGVTQSLYKPSYGLDDLGSIPGRGTDGSFSPRHRVHTSSGAQLTYYLMSTVILTRR